MIHDPTQHHEFVLLLKIKNPPLQSLSWLKQPAALAQDVGILAKQFEDYVQSPVPGSLEALPRVSPTHLA